MVIIIILKLVMPRIFIALTPKTEFNKIICELKEDQKKFLIRNHKVNWSKDNQHHITINFIGSMEPEQREEMFQAFKKALEENDRPYILLKGNKEKRLKTAIQAIDKIISNKKYLYSYSDLLANE